MSGHYLAEFLEAKTAEAEVLPEIKAPKKYKVVLVNDDYTPMDFVVEVLRIFFRLDEQKATKIMLEIHFSGKAVCGVFTKDIAETKVTQVNDYARANEHPLLCGMEPE